MTPPNAHESANAGETSEPGTGYRIREGFVLRVDEETSARMRKVRQKGTRPELIVRSIATGLGLRYRLENRDLPGSPDLANRRRRWAIFVHGCFWHRHGCKASTTPRRNADYWQAKFERNVTRDAESVDALRQMGYRVIVVWECEAKAGGDAIRENLQSSLGGAGPRTASAGTPSEAQPGTEAARRHSR